MIWRGLLYINGLGCPASIAASGVTLSGIVHSRTKGTPCPGRAQHQRRVVGISSD